MYTRLRNIARYSAIALLLMAGCGYKNGGSNGDGSGAGGSGGSGYQWKSVYRENVKTVAVPIFKNVTYQRGIEFTLTTAVVQQIEGTTPYKVIAREQADTILEGEITQVRVDTLSKDPRANIPQEQLVDVTVNFTWKDLRTGRILVSRRGLEQTATFYATLGEGRAQGTLSAAEQLAVVIVQQLQADW